MSVDDRSAEFVFADPAEFLGPGSGKTIVYPPDGGIVLGSKRTFSSLEAFASECGRHVDRIGPRSGDVFFLKGDNFEQRAMTAEARMGVYREYEICCLPAGWVIETAIAREWFGRPGGGTQIQFINERGFAMTAEQLAIDEGVLQRVSPWP